MLKLIKIAITGGVASGKTSVCRVFQELGAFVVDADAIVHELLSHDTNIRQQIIGLLGNEVLIDGKLSRKVIADKVFKNPDALNALEKLLHPAVLKRIEQLYEEACRRKACTAFVVESPLLFEIGHEKLFDIVVAVSCDPSISRERFSQSGWSRMEYEKRMKRQLDPALKEQRADYVIENNGSPDHLREQVTQLNKRIQNQQIA
ncbi:MAG: coaE [Parachlamydiales bacterium]|nr:coaE [Parachlamydiales bacterium]